MITKEETFQVQYIESMAKDFDECKKLYLDEFANYDPHFSIDDFQKKRNRYTKKILKNDAPILRLYKKIGDYWEGERQLVHEIRVNKLGGNQAYFEFCKNVFLVQYTFFENEFPDVLQDFIKNEERCRDLVERLELADRNDPLNNQEFLLAIRFQLVQIFRWLEELYSQEYRDYDPLLLGASYFQGQPSAFNYIRLLYGADINNKVIKLIHDRLNGKYFNVSLPSFKKHFHSPLSFRKITWLGTQSSLILLFHGRNRPYLVGLKTLNTNKAKMLKDHFVQSDGSTYNEQSLGSTPAKFDIYPNTPGAEAIIELLKEIEVNFVVRKN